MSDITTTAVKSGDTDEMTEGAKLDIAVKSAIDAATAQTPDFAGYRSLPVTGRNRVKKAIETRMRAVVGKADMSDPVAVVAAVAEHNRLEALLSDIKGMTASAPKKVIDPVSVIGDRIATLRLAADMLEFGLHAPNGLDAQTIPYQASLLGSVNYTEAVKLATAGMTRKAPTNDVAAAIVEAFESVNEGEFLTTGQIGAKWEDAGGPPKSDTSGRINARLFPTKGTCTVDGVIPGTHPVNGKKGAFKA